MQRLYKAGVGRGRRRAIIKRADAEAVQLKALQRDEKGDNREGGGGGCGCGGRRCGGEKEKEERAVIIREPSSEGREHFICFLISGCSF